MPGMSPNDHLSEAEREQGLRMVIRDGLATQAMVTLTGGVFLVAFALLLGASNTVIGLLAAIPALAELIQIPSVSLVARILDMEEKKRRTKRMKKRIILISPSRYRRTTRRRRCRGTPPARRR